MSTAPTAAVIGAGVSGLTAAYVLSRTHQVTLLEADDRLGGHAHTHDVTGTDGGPLRIDSGFIVHNERTYPHLLRLFDELGVATQPTEMSMSITCEACGLCYAGGRGARGVLAQPRRMADRRFLRMLTEIPRFHREATRLLHDTDEGPSRQDPTWGEFLDRGGYSSYFVAHFALPLVACVWSAGATVARDYPARHLFAFLEHHGMLTVKGSPTWRTVTGGSATYVALLAERLTANGATVLRGGPVTSVTRHPDGVEVRRGEDSRTFDKVVVATHADQALEMLADATPAEKDDLGAIAYSVNETWLHRDRSVLPTPRGARSSWNYRMRCDGAGRGSAADGAADGAADRAGDGVLVSYWMNRLHGVTGAADDHVVTLNPEGSVDPALVTARMRYAHPVFTHEAVAAARRLRTAGGDRLAFAGAHLGWGFHEDGCRSGVEAAASLGVSW